MDKSRAFQMSRAAGFLALFAGYLLTYLSFTLFRYLPPAGNALTPAAYAMNYAGMILGGLLCPLFLPLPFAGNLSQLEKPPALSVAGIVLAVLPNLVIRSLGISVWLNFPAARLLVALSTGLMITIGHGLFFLTWRHPSSKRGKWRAVPLFYAFAMIVSVSALHYSVSLLERLAFEPERVQSLLFPMLKWIVTGFCVFASASVWLFQAAAAPASPSAGEIAAAPGAWGRHGILRMFALLAVWDALNAMLIIRGMPLISNQAWQGTRGVPAAALIVLALAFIAGFSPEKMLRICLPPVIVLFIFMPSLTFFSDYPRFVEIMLFLVSIADLTICSLFAVSMAESCQKAARFYLCSVLVMIATGFAIFGRILGAAASVGAGFTALMIASETVIFLYLALPLMFPKAVPAADGSAAERERIFAQYGLSEREREVMALMLEGLDNDAIGERLHVSNGAVRYHIGNIYGKFGIDGKRGGRSALLAKIMRPEDQGRGQRQPIPTL